MNRATQKEIVEAINQMLLQLSSEKNPQNSYMPIIKLQEAIFWIGSMECDKDEEKPRIMTRN